MSEFKPSRVETSDIEVDAGTLSVDQTGNKVGVGTKSPDNKLHVKSEDGTSKAALKLEQLDVDEPFILFTGTTAADQTKSLTSDTSVGSLAGHVRVSINGTDYWMPFYSTN
tara:strand:- start:397 stop:729 length:333 start_codon:yes stop_codon:yes gene_type:complete